MKIIRFLGVLSLFLTTISNDISAQKSASFEIYYSYLKTADHTYGFINYPFGIGASYSLPLLKRLTFSTGLTYLNRHSFVKQESFIAISEFPPYSLYQTGYQERISESFYLFNIGLYYTLVNKKLSIKIGGNLVPMYSHITQRLILQSHDSTDVHINNSKDFFKIGVKIGVKIEYSVSKKISLYLEPSPTFYLSGKSYFNYNRNTLSPGLQSSIGMIYYLK